MSSERLIATYHVRAGAAEVDAVARAIAIEQSVECPIEAVFDTHVRDHIVGQVAGITPLGPDHYRVDVALALATTGLEPAQALNMLFGNTSMHAHVEFVDIAGSACEALARAFGGPRFGLAGMRDRLRVHARPFTCGAIKPQGMPVAALADVCKRLALGGLDIVKDDHGLANQAYSPFAERIPACQRAIEDANRETGGRAVYAPSLVGGPRALAEQARICREEGVGAVMIAPALVGMPTFREIVAEHVDVPVLAHPSYMGGARVAPPLLLGKLYRMLGADAVIYANYGGRFAYPPQLCAEIAVTSRAPWMGLPAVLPVPAGGMTVERVPELLDFYGTDVMLLIGGSLLTAGEALVERTREFVSMVHSRAAAKAR